VNPITQAIAAAHAITARAAAGRVRPESLKSNVRDIANELPGLDDALVELTGDELLTLALAAEVLAERARAVETYRRNAAVTAEINKLRKV
jgi:hypothetical protein